MLSTMRPKPCQSKTKGAYYTDRSRRAATAADAINKLQNALKKNNHKTAKYFLEKGIGLEDLEDPDSLFLDAVFKNQQKTVELLLDHGVDLNTVMNRRGQTALIIAADKHDCDLSMVETLLRRGADPNHVDRDGNSAMYYAMVDITMFGPRQHIYELVRVLLEYGADANAKNKIGRTLLQVAANQCLINVIDLLVDYDADLEAVDNMGWTTLHHALDHYYCTAHLIHYHGANINAQDKFGRSALHVAADAGMDLIAKLLICSGADTTMVDKCGFTPFMITSYCIMTKTQSFHLDTYQVIGSFLMIKKVAGLEVDERDLLVLAEDFEDGTLLEKFRRTYKAYKKRYPLLRYPLNKKLYQYKKQLEKELSIMKSIRVSDLFSLYDIFLTQDLMYRSNENIVLTLRKVKYRKLPNYKDLIKAKIKNDKKRYELIFLAIECLDSLMEMRRTGEETSKIQLPREIYIKIISNLENVDLIKWIRCFRKLQKPLVNMNTQVIDNKNL